jgi:hypothetical protein
MEDGMFGDCHARTLTGARWRALATVGALAALAACGDDESNLLVVPIDRGTVITVADTGFNFTQLHTFVMPDTVVHLVPVTGTPLAVSRQFDAAILNQVRNDLLARGYIQVTAGSGAADFVVLVGATATQNYNAWIGYSAGAVWGFFPGWNIAGFDQSWALVYPWFPAAGVTAFDRGTLLVTIVPAVQVQPLAHTVNSVWAGVATGALNGLTQSQVTGAIDEMFRQSPYLVAGPVVNPL